MKAKIFAILLIGQCFLLNGGTTQVAFPSVGTKVTIQSALGASFPWDFFIDNITFTKPLPENKSVPEPATMLLFGGGLIGLSVFKPKKFIK